MLKDKMKFLFDENNIRIGVLGMGKDGWQLACRMAMFDYCSLGFSIRPEIAETTNNGVNYLHDNTVIDNPGLVRSKLVYQSKLNGTTDIFSATHRDIVFVCVSDLAEEYEKDFNSALKCYTEAIAMALRAETVLVFLDNKQNKVSVCDVTDEIAELSGLNSKKDFCVLTMPEEKAHNLDASNLLADVIAEVRI